MFKGFDIWHICVVYIYLLGHSSSFNLTPSLVLVFLTIRCIKLVFPKMYRECKSTSHSFMLFVNQIPNILNLGGFHSICKCGIYLTREFCLLLSHMALVFPVFKKRPDVFPNVLMVLTVSSDEFSSPSSIISVSSAYCEILYTVSPMKILFLYSYFV